MPSKLIVICLVRIGPASSSGEDELKKIWTEVSSSQLNYLNVDLILDYFSTTYILRNGNEMALWEDTVESKLSSHGFNGSP